MRTTAVKKPKMLTQKTAVSFQQSALGISGAVHIREFATWDGRVQVVCSGFRTKTLFLLTA
jgi:hypothetical protein